MSDKKDVILPWVELQDLLMYFHTLGDEKAVAMLRGLPAAPETVSLEGVEKWTPFYEKRNGVGYCGMHPSDMGEYHKISDLRRLVAPVNGTILEPIRPATTTASTDQAPVQPSAVVSRETIGAKFYNAIQPDQKKRVLKTTFRFDEVAKGLDAIHSLQLPQPVAPQFYTLPDLGNQPVAPCPDCEGDTEFGLCETCGSRGHTQPVAPVQGGGVEFGEPSAWMWQGPHGTACGVNNPFEDDSPEFQRKHGVVALYCKSDLTTTQSAPGTPSTRPVAFMAPDGQFERLSEGCDPDQYRGWTPLYGAPSVGSVPRDDNHVKNVINGWKKSWSVKLSSRAEGALRDRIEKLLTSRTEGK